MEFPKNWDVSTLPMIVGANGLISDGDWIESKDQDPEGKIRLIQLADIGDGIFKDKSNRFMNQQKADLLRCTFLKPGDVLLARMPDPLGRACIFPTLENKSVTVVDVCIIRLSENSALLNTILMCWINTPYVRNVINMQATGTTRQRITRKKLADIELPIPPLNEQIRIANKFDSLLAKVDAAQARLEKIPTLLKRFRQSVLAAATSGELTSEWREERPEGSALQELNMLKATRNSLTSRLPKASLAPPNVNFDVLPDSWIYSDISPFLDIERAGMKTGPFGSLLKKSEHTTSGIPVIGIENITKSGFKHGSKIQISVEKAEYLCGYDLRPGDIVISRSGTVGETCVIPNDIGEARFSTNIMRLSFINRAINPMFFKFLFVGSNVTLKQVAELCKGSTRLFLNQKILSSIRYPIPPLMEQNEIVRRVESLFALADAVEKQYREAKRHIDRLTQSLLAKAFRGELVPQDPNYESAAELSKRIKAEREVQSVRKQEIKTATPKQAIKTRKKSSTMALNNISTNHLSELLIQLGGEAHAEVLWKKSELSIDDFYARLKQNIKSGAIVDDNSSADPSLRKLKIAQSEMDKRTKRTR